MKDIEAKDSTGAFVQDLYYEWNDAGSLTKRQDTYHEFGSSNTLTEIFGYDGLNRLTSHGESGQAALTVTYDGLGNIKTKSGVQGTYNYGSNAGPHALTSINGQVYNYDENGNNISGGGRSIVYSTFDKPTRISKGGNTVDFAYSSDHSRYRRIDQDSNGTTTTRYIGNVEIIERPNGTQERKRYIAGVAIETGFYSGGNETSRETIYTLKDHLGSLDVILDDAGQVEQKLSFGPWGQRRDATNWKEVSTSSTLIDLGSTFDLSRTTRGFTGHEMVDSVGIVHMNGRIYDPFLGRFLQADNYVQDPANTQSHNRYSYVWNNPLNATDPSGEFIFSLLAIALIAAENIINVYVIAAIFAVAGTLDALMAGADLSSAFLSGIISGVSAGAFAKVGSVLGGKFGGNFAAGLSEVGFTLKVISHGLIGGITSTLQGGKLGHGFASAVFTAGATSFNSSKHFGPEGFSWKRIAVGAAIGGSASKLSGGKFANGAITGSFSQALNNEISEEKAFRVRNARSFADKLIEFHGDLVRNAGELFDPLLFPSIDASLDAGENAAQFWADKSASTGNSAYDFPGGLASLWTRDTALRTSLTLIPLGGGAGAHAGRPFWQYSSSAGSGSTWLARGFGWGAPYRPGYQAASQLALPAYNSGMVVTRVNVPWYRFVWGPRVVAPQPTFTPIATGGGLEYRLIPFGH